MDLRSAEDFAKVHIQGARSYPKEFLARDKITAELYGFKTGSNGGRLVVYDVDDKSTAKAATQLVEKGWACVYVLSGGIEEVGGGPKWSSYSFCVVCWNLNLLCFTPARPRRIKEILRRCSLEEEIGGGTGASSRWT